MSAMFRDEEQRRAVCERLLRIAHYDLAAQRAEIPTIEDVARVRRARTLYDLVLTIYEGKGVVTLDHLIELDQDTRSVVGDLIADLQVSNHTHTDTWLRSTTVFLEEPGR